MKKVNLLYCLFIFYCGVANASIIKENTYGKMYTHESSSTLRFEGGIHTVTLIPSPDGIRYNFKDGSYIQINSKTATVTRYSKKTFKKEVLTINNINTSPWNVSANVRAAFKQLQYFDETPNMPYQNCYDGEISIPCLGDFSSGFELIKNSSQFSYSTNNCSAERAELQNRAYDGTSSMFSCSLDTKLGVAAASLWLAALALGEPSKLSVAAAWTGYMSTFVAFMNQEKKCYESFLESKAALKQCEINNNPNNSDGSSSGGSTGNGSAGGGSAGGGSAGGGSSEFCSKTIRHAVCTGGGCNYWYEIVPC